jgi:hypothetical protein
MRHRSAAVGLAISLVAIACTSQTAPPTSTKPPTSTVGTEPPPPTTSTTAAAPILPILPHDTVDPSTMTGKLLMGYQGWFTCPGDDSANDGWYHWIRDGAAEMDAMAYRPDMWPDTSELTEEERCPTAMAYPDGSPAHLYTMANPNTVLRHFQWMAEYGIDGVFLQRFGSQLIYPSTLAQRDQLTAMVADSAESYGRVWAVMYDITGIDERPVDLVETISADWIRLVDEAGVTADPVYLRHKGLPIVALWGLGFADRAATPAEAMELVSFFRDNPDPKYRATVMGGVPFFWRVPEPPADPDPAWAEYYCSLDVISPWTVGAYGTTGDVDFWHGAMVEDIAHAADCGAEYMPVVYPGHSYHNPDPSRPFNEYPRMGGRLYWHQVYRALEAGATMIYNAMFDEVDEGTAMYKVAATLENVPVGLEVVTMDADGECLPSDWYLTLAGEATRMLRGEIPLTDTIPITPPPCP